MTIIMKTAHPSSWAHIAGAALSIASDAPPPGGGVMEVMEVMEVMRTTVIITNGGLEHDDGGDSDEKITSDL